MTPSLSVLLCLGLILGQRMRTLADRPFLRAPKGPLVPVGENVILTCRGSWGTKRYLLEKDQEPGMRKILDVRPPGGEGKFLIPTVTAKDAGKYYCRSYHSHRSERSNPVELVVTGLYDPPSLSALPSSQVASGQQVTLHCQSEGGFARFALYKNGEKIEEHQVQTPSRGAQASFPIPAVTPAHGGPYRCYTFHSDKPYVWSAPSNALVLRVTGPGTTKDPHLTPSPGNTQLVTSSPPKIFPTPKPGHSLFGLSFLNKGIFIGISTFIILLILLLLLLWRRHRQHRRKLRNGGREAEAKTTRSSDPDGTPLEEILYADVSKDRQTEEVRPKDTAAPPREVPQEVTYAQLNLNSLKLGVEDLPTSGSEDPSLYAALQ